MIGIDVVSIERIKAFQDRFGIKALAKSFNALKLHLAKNDATIAGFCGKRGNLKSSRSWYLPNLWIF